MVASSFSRHKRRSFVLAILNLEFDFRAEADLFYSGRLFLSNSDSGNFGILGGFEDWWRLEG